VQGRCGVTQARRNAVARKEAETKGTPVERLSLTEDGHDKIVALAFGEDRQACQTLLAKSGIQYPSPYKDAVASGCMTRAKADLRVFSRATPANQSATRSRLMAAAVARCWR